MKKQKEETNTQDIPDGVSAPIQKKNTLHRSRAKKKMNHIKEGVKNKRGERR